MVLGIAPVVIIDGQLPFEYTIISRSTDVMALPVQNIKHLAFRSMFEREKLSKNNFNDWFRQLKLVLRVEKKMYVIEQPLPVAHAADSQAQEKAASKALPVLPGFRERRKLKQRALNLYVGNGYVHKKKAIGNKKGILKSTEDESLDNAYLVYQQDDKENVVPPIVPKSEATDLLGIIHTIGRPWIMKRISREDTSPSKITSEIPIDVEGFEPPQEEVIPVRRSERTHRALDHLCLNVERRNIV
ncbi:hypothetical protein Tco_0601886 [Tanacetum coccineum]